MGRRVWITGVNWGFRAFRYRHRSGLMAYALNRIAVIKSSHLALSCRRSQTVVTSRWELGTLLYAE